MQPKGSPAAFFALVFALSIPFWLLGAATRISLLPGLPVAALAVACPALAALILTFRSAGAGGARTLLARAFDHRRVGRLAWYLPLLLTAPAVYAACFAVMRMSGVAVPAPRFELLPILFLWGFFFVGAIGEELGWSGYAVEPLQARWGPLRASLILGAVWATWHLIALVQAHRPLAWIAWWTLGTVAARVVMVWLFNRTGHSVFGQILFHTASNVSWQLFPVQGSWFDPRIYGPMMVLLALVSVWAGPLRPPSPRSPRGAGLRPGCGR